MILVEHLQALTALYGVSTETEMAEIYESAYYDMKTQIHPHTPASKSPTQEQMQQAMRPRRLDVR